MERFRALMTHKVLGIPAGVFVLIFAGVILFFAIRMRNSAATSDTTDTTAGGDADTGPADDTQQPTFSASDVELPVATATPIVAQTVTNDTNDAWKRRTIEWLMGNGYTVEVATTAISNYLNGEPLTDAQAKARDAAVKQFGLPPEDIPDTIKNSTNPKPRLSNSPAVSQGKPPLNHIVKGSRDNTAAELAVLYYGTNDSDAVEKIRSANTTKVEPYAVGTSVRITEAYRPRYFTSTHHINTVYEIARKNGDSPAQVEALNPGMNFPVKAGTRVRVH